MAYAGAYEAEHGSHRVHKQPLQIPTFCLPRIRVRSHILEVILTIPARLGMVPAPCLCLRLRTDDPNVKG